MSELESDLGVNTSHTPVSPPGSPKSLVPEESSRIAVPLSRPSGPDTNPDERNPSGATMLARNLRHHDMVLAILPNYPGTRGDDTLLWLMMLRKYYHKQVEVHISPKGGEVVLRFRKYESLLFIPTPESARRRRQQIQQSCRESIWETVANLPGINTADADWRETDEAKHEFEKLAKKSDLLPTARTLRKRKRNEVAQHGFFGNGQSGLGDWD
jgi:hypothetical protein